MVVVPQVVEPGSALFTSVKSLGDEHSKYLGLLPHAAWAEYAEAGHICAMVDDAARDTPLAYVAYRTPRNEIVVAHLVVRSAARGLGLARCLIDFLRGSYPDRMGISLSCRRDYPAHAMWPKLGFVARGEKPGRGKGRLPLTRWWLDFGHPTLLTWDGPADSLVPVMIDMNILIDLTCDNPGPVECGTREVFNSLHDRIEVIVSPEAANEIDRNPDEIARRRLRGALGAYTEISANQDEFVRIEAQLADESTSKPNESRQTRSDRMHIAYAAVAGVTTVVTRDGAARRRLGPVSKRMFEINLVTPAALKGIVDEIENTSLYSPGPLLGTAYRRVEAGVNDSADVDAFIDTAASERRSSFQELRDSIAAAKPLSTMSIVYTPGARPLALVGIDVSGKHAIVRIARMYQDPLSVSMAAQLVQNIRDYSRLHQKNVIRVTDMHVEATIREALISDGFRQHETGLIGASLDGYLTPRQFESQVDVMLSTLNEHSHEQTQLSCAIHRINALAGADRIAAIEHELRPMRYDSEELPTWMVPIKPQFSTDLFGYPDQLFERPSNLGLSREHVYYKARPHGESPPGRIIWYASGGSGEAFACSSLIECVDDTPQKLHRRFRRLGVYTYEQVCQTSNNDVARALRVADTVVFPHPVGLRRLRQLGKAMGQQLPAQSSVRLVPEVAASIIREGQFGIE
ncbi:GNAT family N-acetyltransferase [Gordonia sp. DT219]|uniref:GNAT family N-acetyltransferase n=1 Tax=Gordonia sp. DT219 TaxID=3416658 RepID=UPI003CE9F748